MVNRNAMSHITSETLSAAAMLLADDEIKAVIRHGFKPFRCVVEILPDRQNAELQTQAADPTNGMSKLMRPLEHRVVVKLGIGGQAVMFPSLQQARHRCLGAHTG